MASPQPLHLSVGDSGFPTLSLVFGAQGLNTQYIWNTVYVSTNGITWTPRALSGGVQLNGWFRNNGTLTLASSIGQYGAVGTPGVWTYVAYLLLSAQPNGMRNAAGPLLPLKWQVQGFCRVPLPIITINPTNPNIPDTTPLGTTVATVSVVMDDGTPWTGSLILTNNLGNIFAISGSNIIVNPSGPGVGPNAQDQVDNITVEALQ